MTGPGRLSTPPRRRSPRARSKNLVVDFPPGFVADPTAVPRCSNADFLSFRASGGKPDWAAARTPPRSGHDRVKRSRRRPVSIDYRPVYNLDPAPRGGGEARLPRPERSGHDRGRGQPRAPLQRLRRPDQTPPRPQRFYGSKLTLWGDPGRPRPRPRARRLLPGQRRIARQLPRQRSPKGPSSPCRAAAPGRCRPSSRPTPGRRRHLARRRSRHPRRLRHRRAARHDRLRQARLPPRDLRPADHRLGREPTGLDFNLDIDDEGLTNPTGIAAVRHQEGGRHPARGGDAQPLRGRRPRHLLGSRLGSARRSTPNPGEGCPQASKVGTVEVETPLLEGELLKGALFVAPGRPGDRPTRCREPLRLPARPLHGDQGPRAGDPGQAGRARSSPNPRPGSWSPPSANPHEIPQVPFSHFRFHFREGGRSPLVTPPRCGTYTTEAVLTPWADPANPLTVHLDFQITRASAAAPAPRAAAALCPGLQRRLAQQQRRLLLPLLHAPHPPRRRPGHDRFSATLPPGVVGKLAGVAQCPDAAIAAAKAKTGRAGAGLPQLPRQLADRQHPGRRGGRLSAHLRPRQALPRRPLRAPRSAWSRSSPPWPVPSTSAPSSSAWRCRLNPQTAEVEVDGAHSDPIPHILDGIPLKVRDMRVYADRPNFTLNPTNCEPFAIKATLFGRLPGRLQPRR